jgi:signal peptide peptidase-like protein 2B
MDGHGQPTLLYLVPCTLGLILILALLRREFKDLWVYEERAGPKPQDEILQA